MEPAWIIGIAVVILGAIGWFWAERSRTTMNTLDPTGTAIDDAVKEAEEYANTTAANTANMRPPPDKP